MEKKKEIRKKERAKYNKWYYENVYWVEDLPNKQHDRDFNYNDPTHEKRFDFLKKLLINNFKFNTFLDVGCGMGHLIRGLSKEKYECKGIEVSKDALKYYLSDLAKKNVVFLAGMDKMPFRNNEFDLTFCSDVMEHIPLIDVKDSIKELIRVTKKYLVLTINLDNPYGYHPTMLSRGAWENLFLKDKNLKQLKNLERSIGRECKKRYKEYDFFIFQKNNLIPFNIKSKELY